MVRYRAEGFDDDSDPNTSTILPVAPLVQRLRVPKTPSLLPLQMTTQRVTAAERLPAPSDHQHPVAL